MYITDFPNLIKFEIIKNLDKKSISNLSKTCKFWNNFIDKNYYKSLCLQAGKQEDIKPSRISWKKYYIFNDHLRIVDEKKINIVNKFEIDKNFKILNMKICGDFLYYSYKKISSFPIESNIGRINLNTFDNFSIQKGWIFGDFLIDNKMRVYVFPKTENENPQNFTTIKSINESIISHISKNCFSFNNVVIGAIGDYLQKIVKIDFNEGTHQIHSLEKKLLECAPLDDNFFITTTECGKILKINYDNFETEILYEVCQNKGVLISDLKLVGDNLIQFTEKTPTYLLLERIQMYRQTINIFSCKTRKLSVSIPKPDGYSFCGGIGSYFFFKKSDDLLVYDTLTKKDFVLKVNNSSEIKNIQTNGDLLVVQFEDSIEIFGVKKNNCVIF